MSKVLAEVIAANQAYAANFGKKGALAMPPARHFAILTCMDARLQPSKFAGFAEGGICLRRENWPAQRSAGSDETRQGGAANALYDIPDCR